MAIHRNRVVYQSEALFVSPNATGFHYTGAEGYGLTTPPTGATQSTGGFHADGSPYGWSCGDQWPEWNPDGTQSSYAKGHDIVHSNKNHNSRYGSWGIDSIT